MFEVFPYNTIKTNLRLDTHSLEVTLNKNNEDYTFSWETLFELEGLLQWLNQHIEVHSVLFNANSEIFGKGWKESEWNNFTDEQFKKATDRLKRLFKNLRSLPQFTICDLCEGSSALGTEFALNCDYRISFVGPDIKFNHLEFGILPIEQSISIAKEIFGAEKFKNIILLQEEFNTMEEDSEGFIHQVYKDGIQKNRFINKIKKKVQNLPPVLRIEFKNMMYAEKKKEQSSEDICFISGDWKEASTAKTENRAPDFMKARSYREILNEVLKLKDIEEKNENFS